MHFVRNIFVYLQLAVDGTAISRIIAVYKISELKTFSLPGDDKPIQINSLLLSNPCCNDTTFQLS